MVQTNLENQGLVNSEYLLQISDDYYKTLYDKKKEECKKLKSESALVVAMYQRMLFISILVTIVMTACCIIIVNKNNQLIKDNILLFDYNEKLFETNNNLISQMESTIKNVNYIDEAIKHFKEESIKNNEESLLDENKTYLLEENNETSEEFLKNHTVKDIIESSATAYDLSVQCCGKTIEDTGYGITAYGVDISNKTREEAMAIAVDPEIIPLGSYVYIEFNEEYEMYNGVYYACDVGEAVKGNKIDLFMGDFNSEEANQQTKEFGVTDCTVYVLGDYNGER